MSHFREKGEMMTATEISVACEEGRAEGEARGELKKSIEIARRHIEMGADMEEVKSLTWLSNEQLSKLDESRTH